MKGLATALLIFFCLNTYAAETYWMKIKATNKVERTEIANTGVVIEAVYDDSVFALGGKEELQQLGDKVIVSYPFRASLLDFPNRDEKFHNYNELIEILETLEREYPEIVRLEDIGQSIEGRRIINIRISTDLDSSHEKAGIIFMGTHHAREHLSTETPILLAQYLAREFKNGNTRIQGLLRSREIHIVPMVNPDGVEHDIAGGTYKHWRKNRRNNGDGTYGVDLNRNYSFQWNTGGSSDNTRSDVYHGPSPFSEPETQAVKAFVESTENATILLSFHTFSELILYPWGHSYDSIANSRDYQVHKRMAETMARWNRYTPQQSSELYIASGDTTDWSYGELGLISFTFELDPKSMWSGGFYPGQDLIDVVFEKNLEPCLYLIEHADNPYRVLLKSNAQKLGLSSPLF